MGAPRIRTLTLGASPNDRISTGARAASGWFTDRGFTTPTLKRWHVEVSLATLDSPAPLHFDERTDSRFHVDIYAEEWGCFFCHGGKTSWIRVTDIPFVHGRDDFGLLARAPSLADIGTTMRTLETEHRVVFRRKFALVRTNVASAEAPIRRWVESL